MAIAKQRESNLELYRIIIMILIVAHHYVVNSGLTELMSQAPTSVKSLYLYAFGIWGKTGINCFVLITGYFMCQSRITLRKFSKLLLWIYFYKIVIFFIFCITGYVDFSVRTLGVVLLPIRNITDSFVGCYLVFFLTIPFLNILVKNMNRRQHLLLLALTLFIYSLWAKVPHIEVRMNYVTWFGILYLISSYMRIYNVFDGISHRKWGWITLCSVVVSVLSVWTLAFLGVHYVYFFVFDSNAILAVVVSVCAFMYFKTCPLQYHRWINSVGASTFGVLLIHDNCDAMRQWLWKDTLNNVAWFSDQSHMIYLHSIVSVLGIFMICTLIDQLRLKYIEKPLFKALDSYMEKRGNRFVFQWT